MEMGRTMPWFDSEREVTIFLVRNLLAVIWWKFSTQRDPQDTWILAQTQPNSNTPYMSWLEWWSYLWGHHPKCPPLAKKQTPCIACLTSACVSMKQGPRSWSLCWTLSVLSLWFACPSVYIYGQLAKKKQLFLLYVKCTFMLEGEQRARESIYIANKHEESSVMASISSSAFHFVRKKKPSGRKKDIQTGTEHRTNFAWKFSSSPLPGTALFAVFSHPQYPLGPLK